jgi:CshA-type fibril repeat protein
MYFLKGNVFEIVDLNPSSPNYLTRRTLNVTPSTPATGVLNDFAFNPVDGNIYGVSSDVSGTLYRFSPVTGVRTILGPISGAGGNNSFGTAFFDNQGNLYIGHNTTGSFYKIASTQSGNTVATLYNDNPVGFSPGDGARCATFAVPPSANSDVDSTNKNTPVTIAIIPNDKAGSFPIDPTSILLIDPADSLSKTSVSIPAVGTFTANASGTVIFEPATDYLGLASIAYTLKDTQGNESNVATIDVTVIDAMPVTLIKFESTKEGETVLLSWSTTEESHSSHFEIQKRNKNTGWMSIGTVSAQGESRTVANYDFIDRNPDQDNNLYRLRMVDTDNTFAYSQIVSINLGGKAKKNFPYPNPSTDKIYFDQTAAKIELIEVFDPKGEKMIRTRKTISGYINLEHLAPGPYFVRIKLENGESETFRIAKK